MTAAWELDKAPATEVFDSVGTCYPVALPYGKAPRSRHADLETLGLVAMSYMA